MNNIGRSIDLVGVRALTKIEAASVSVFVGAIPPCPHKVSTENPSGFFVLCTAHRPYSRRYKVPSPGSVEEKEVRLLTSRREDLTQVLQEQSTRLIQAFSPYVMGALEIEWVAYGSSSVLSVVLLGHGWGRINPLACLMDEAVKHATKEIACLTKQFRVQKAA